MVHHRSGFITSLVMFITLFVTACAFTPDETDMAEYRLPVEEAEVIFEAGFSNIAEKYIDSISLETLAIEGIRGLSALDTGLSLYLDSDSLDLTYHRKTIRRLIKPGKNDAPGWASVVASMASEAQSHSNEIKSSDPETIYEAVFDGAISTLDVYSRYAGKSEAIENRARRDGFGGIGVRFQEDQERILITEILPHSPAEKAGVQVNDELTTIGNRAITGMRTQSIVKMLRGPVGSIVNIVIARQGINALSLSLKRSHIVPPTVKADIQDDILHLKISSFNQGTASSIVSELRQTLNPEGGSKHNIKGVVLDLRGNPGGLLKQSIEVADAFLIHGDILNTRGRHPDSVQHYEATGQDQAMGLPMVVLIDGKSASAAEIVAAALQDRERAVVLGTSSYGKGTVQTVIRLPNSGEITLTWSRFMAPSGYTLHELGVFPIICTSGSAQQTDSFLQNALDNHDRTLGTLATWRSTSHQNSSTFKALRSECPPERHNGKSDIDIARVLIEDGALYFKALDLTSDTAHAIN